MVAPGLVALLLSSPLAAATIEAIVSDGRGGAVHDAVVYAVPEGRPVTSPRRGAVMEQKNRAFIPHVLAVQTGTTVRFPNLDDVQHHVYSFSSAKPFQLPLYKGNPPNPVVFEKAGVVTLGCNIHDQMSAYIVVVDTPYFEKTAANGRAALRDLEPGRYTVHVWAPEMRGDPASRTVTVTDSERVDVSFNTGR
ncbi:MAG TPA: methylamine utilization protein [Thermoanaerobaculia bacterium]|nr:methylamine utilization protein [Thermoanaerobaculia bacterium]